MNEYQDLFNVNYTHKRQLSASGAVTYRDILSIHYVHQSVHRVNTADVDLDGPLPVYLGQLMHHEVRFQSPRPAYPKHLASCLHIVCTGHYAHSLRILVAPVCDVLLSLVQTSQTWTVGPR